MGIANIDDPTMEARVYPEAMAGQEGEAEDNNAQRATPTCKGDHDQLQELTSKCDRDDDDGDVEMLRALFEKEKQCLARDLVELANVLTQKMRDCQRVITEEHSSNWEEEKMDLIRVMKKLQELYLDKERSHKEDVLLHNQERNELSRKLMDATWGHQNFRLLYNRSVQEKRELAAQLDHAISSAEYYRAYFYNVYETCHKLEEQNKVLSERLYELEDKCSWLEEDKQNLTVSLEAAEANTELYISYLHNLRI